MSGLSTLIDHVRHLQLLLDRMEPDNIQHPRIAARLEEAKAAAEAERIKNNA